MDRKIKKNKGKVEYRKKIKKIFSEKNNKVELLNYLAENNELKDNVENGSGNKDEKIFNKKSQKFVDTCNKLKALTKILKQNEYSSVIGKNFDAWYGNLQQKRKINLYNDLIKCKWEATKMKIILKAKQQGETICKLKNNKNVVNKEENLVKNIKSKKIKDDITKKEKKSKAWNISDELLESPKNIKKTKGWSIDDTKEDIIEDEQENSLVRYSSKSADEKSSVYYNFLENYLNENNDEYSDSDDSDFTNNFTEFDDDIMEEDSVDLCSSDEYTIDSIEEYSDNVLSMDEDCKFSDCDSNSDFNEESFDSNDYSSESSENLLEDKYCDEYMDESVSDSEDEDYSPPDEYLFIKQGTAKVYNIPKNSKVQFSNENESQIIEMKTSSDESDDSSCPELVPIYPNNVDKCSSKKISNEKPKVEDSETIKNKNEIKENGNINNKEVITINKNIECPINFCENNNTDDETESTLLEHIRLNRSIGSNKIDYDNLDDDNNIVINPESIDNMARSKDVKFYNSINSDYVLLVLKSKVYFNGCLKITLIEGNAECFGYQFKHNNTQIAYSPRGQSLLYLSVIKGKKKNTKPKYLENKLNHLKEFFVEKDLIHIIKNYQEKKSALFLLERDISNQKRIVERYMEESVFPHIESIEMQRPYSSTEFLLHTKFHINVDKSLEISSQWEQLKLQDTSRYILIGGKGVGKTTLARYLVNKNINKYSEILFIDLDIGQSELFLPQTISATLLNTPILGSGCFHNFKPYYSLLYGNVSVAESPIKYIKCVTNLINMCKNNENFNNIPWIVNCMGYSQGFGVEIIAFILKLLKPTNVVQISGALLSENYNNIITDEFINSFNFNIFSIEAKALSNNIQFQIDVIKSNSKIKTIGSFIPKENRMMIILCNIGFMLRKREKWLTDVVPFKAPLDQLKIYSSVGDIVLKDQFAQALNASLVYLCHTGNEYDDTLIECFGIGIVRYVDEVKNVAYLLPSISEEILTKVNTLVLTSITLPSPIYLKHSFALDNHIVPYTNKIKESSFVGSNPVYRSFYRPEPRKFYKK